MRRIIDIKKIVSKIKRLEKLYQITGSEFMSLSDRGKVKYFQHLKACNGGLSVVIQLKKEEV